MSKPDARQSSGCIIVGAGPAGMILGLLLARRGVRVQVLEMHTDFRHRAAPRRGPA